MQSRLFGAMTANLTIYDIPAELLKEFAVKVVQPKYPGGVSEAIRDLMRKAVQRENTAEAGKPDTNDSRAQK